MVPNYHRIKSKLLSVAFKALHNLALIRLYTCLLQCVTLNYVAQLVDYVFVSPATLGAPGPQEAGLIHVLSQTLPTQ